MGADFTKELRIMITIKAYMCETCGGRSDKKADIKKCELYHKKREAIVHCDEFEITEQHLKLIQKQNVKHETHGEYGATEIDPKKPYGNSYVEIDIAEILEIQPKG